VTLSVEDGLVRVIALQLSLIKPLLQGYETITLNERIYLVMCRSNLLLCHLNRDSVHVHS